MKAHIASALSVCLLSAVATLATACGSDSSESSLSGPCRTTCDMQYKCETDHGGYSEKDYVDLCGQACMVAPPEQCELSATTCEAYRACLNPQPTF